mmetsp:Transcript_32870/g.53198  ORF Transcript_32870/g.53198 Transcript_32870/m.53198 type:complete len:89 (+) Transcript_32870:417-683(+)
MAVFQGLCGSSCMLSFKRQRLADVIKILLMWCESSSPRGITCWHGVMSPCTPARTGANEVAQRKSRKTGMSKKEERRRRAHSRLLLAC